MLEILMWRWNLFKDSIGHGSGSFNWSDFFEVILEGAKEDLKHTEIVLLRTGTDSNNYDLLLERALIHHIKGLNSCFKEAFRLLINGGFYIEHDRNPEPNIQDFFLYSGMNHVCTWRTMYTQVFLLLQTWLQRKHLKKVVVG
jgi:hypothetical protein